MSLHDHVVTGTRKLSLFDGIEPEFATTRPPATTEDEDLDEFTKLLDLELRQSQSMNFGLIDEDGQFRLEAEAVVFHDIDAGL